MIDPTKATKTGDPSLAHEFSSVLDDAQALLRHAGGEAGKGYADARARLENSVRSARERFGSLQRRRFPPDETEQDIPLVPVDALVAEMLRRLRAVALKRD